MKEPQIPVCAPEHQGERHQHLAAPHPMPSDDQFFQGAELFRQLCEGTRLKILWLLSCGEICVCDLAETLGMSAPAVSHHLRSLRQVGLITYRRVGKAVNYKLSDGEDGVRIHRMMHDVFGIEADSNYIEE